MSSVKIHDYIATSSPTNGTNATETIPKSYQDSIWARFKGILPHREDLVVAGREVKGGIVIHPIIATAALGALVAIGLGIRAEINSELRWQHDQILTLSTQKTEAEKYATKKDEELQKRFQNMDAVQIVLGRDIAKLQEAQKARDTRQ